MLALGRQPSALRAMLSEAKPPRMPGLSVRLYVLLLVGAVLAPVLLLAGLLGQRLVASERAGFEADVTASAKSIAAVIERELTGLIETMEALAVSPPLASGDLQAFHQQAASLNGTLGVATFLRDPATGRQVLNSLIPWGQPLPTRSSLAPWDARLRSAAAPIVSDHFVGITGGSDRFAVAMPVRDAEQRVAYLLHLSIPAERLRSILAGIDMRPGWVGALVDRQGIVVARSRSHAEAVGERATIADRLAATPGELSGHTLDRDGREIFFAARRSAISGWAIVASAPTEDVELPLRRMSRAGALGFALLVGGSILAAWLLGARLARSVQGLAAFGAVLDAGRAAGTTAAVTPIREVNEVGAVLARSASARVEADRQQHLMLQELNHRVKNTLATVQALASLTARKAGDVESYRSRLVERLSGLARTHTLLTDANWEGADLAAMLRSELAIHDGRAGPATMRVDLEGPPVLIPAAKVAALGMLFHELATNAAKYGALSLPEGRIRVRWTRIGSDAGGRDAGGRPVLELAWEESGGPPVSQPAREGFGTRMIRQGLARQLDARVVADFAPTGLRLALSMPLLADATTPVRGSMPEPGNVSGGPG